MAAAALAAKPAEAVGALAGLQAQHANSPYIALWSRVRDFGILDLETALEERSVVKATDSMPPRRRHASRTGRHGEADGARRGEPERGPPGVLQ